ncbi:hypothetical protein [Desulfosporosinus shakirovi]
MAAGIIEVISGEEPAELLEFVSRQNSDGYIESLEQRPIKTPDGEMYGSFWNHENYSLKLESKIKNSDPDPGNSSSVMEGM